jgi:hypothetical protein
MIKATGSTTIIAPTAIMDPLFRLYMADNAIPRKINKSMAVNEVADPDFIVVNVTTDSLRILTHRLPVPARSP